MQETCWVPHHKWNTQLASTHVLSPLSHIMLKWLLPCSVNWNFNYHLSLQMESWSKRETTVLCVCQLAELGLQRTQNIAESHLHNHHPLQNKTYQGLFAASHHVQTELQTSVSHDFVPELVFHYWFKGSEEQMTRGLNFFRNTTDL